MLRANRPARKAAYSGRDQGLKLAVHYRRRLQRAQRGAASPPRRRRARGARRRLSGGCEILSRTWANRTSLWIGIVAWPLIHPSSKYAGTLSSVANSSRPMRSTILRRSSCWWVSANGAANLSVSTGLGPEGCPHKDARDRTKETPVLAGYHPTAQPGKKLRARNVPPKPNLPELTFCDRARTAEHS
jgi:hypothetical protein